MQTLTGLDDVSAKASKTTALEIFGEAWSGGIETAIPISSSSGAVVEVGIELPQCGLSCRRIRDGEEALGLLRREAGGRLKVIARGVG